MKLQLKTIAGALIFEGNFASVAELVTATIGAKKSLRSADLRSANLSSANLSYADLRSADLRSANLSSADLSYADLRYANLSSANLRYADLSYADLRSADLSSADLSSAKTAKLAIASTRILADGSLIVWKKCRGDVIVRMRVPEDAKRSNAWGRKCRAEFVDVLEVIGAEIGVSMTDSGPRTEYTKGARVTCDKWDEDFTNECAGGIHFYITREEAEAHT